MPTFQTFSRRKANQARQGEPDIYSYDQAPDQMRHQMCLALAEGVGRFHVYRGHEFQSPPNANEWWEEMDRICLKEFPSYLEFTSEQNLANRFLNFTRQVISVDDFLSAIEIGCIALSRMRDRHPVETAERGAKSTGAEAISEINERFEQHGVGYQFESGQIIQIDSKIIHSEVTKPVLSLLSSEIFSKAEADFMTAHRHYRSGALKDCVTAANRAYESMLKAICDIEQWNYDKGDRASELVTKVTNNGLFTHDFDQSFTAFIAMLKTGLPSVRNNAGGHGEGLNTQAVTNEIARFALNMTASNMLFLGETYCALKRRPKP